MRGTNEVIGWRRVLAAAAILGVLAIAAALYLRFGRVPTPAELTARDFVAAWNSGDFGRAYSYLDTPIASNIFVDALTHSPAPARDIQIQRVVWQNDRQALVAYSANVPDVVSSTTTLVLANRFRYPSECSDANRPRIQLQRRDDTLDLEQNAAGAWRIGLRGDSDFTQQGAQLLALEFDLAPQFVWGHITAGLDAKDDRYDDEVIFEALNVYRNDLGMSVAGGNSATQTAAIHRNVIDVTAGCRDR
jgi:hypothetical protein